MDVPALFTSAVTLGTLTVLTLTRIGPDAAFLTALALLLVAGVLTPAEALAGFANPGVLTVALLYVVVAGLRETGGVHWISHRLLVRARTLQSGTLRVTAPVTVLSAFLNNTPVVAMLIPAVRDWAQSVRISPSKLMIPLSYAAILGGTCTLIGTSTNLVVDGLLQAHDGTRLGIFTIAWVGVPTAIVGMAFLWTIGPRLLPNRAGFRETVENPREYSVAVTVDPKGPLVGATVERAGLRHLSGLYLAEIERDGDLIAAVGPDERLQGGDRLVFVGMVDSVVQLQRIQGLSPAEDQVFKLDGHRSRRSMVEAVVSESSPTAGRTIRESGFRNRYDAVVIAVARAGKRLRAKVGDIRLRPGDTLLLEARPDFARRMRHARDFYLVSEVHDSHAFRSDRALTAGAIMALMVAIAALGLLSMFEAALIAALAMLAFRCVPPTTARQSVDGQVLITIAAAFGLGAALDSTGVAATLATGLTSLAGTSATGNLVAIYLATALASAIITNNAAAVLIFPVAIEVATGLGVSLVPFAITVMMAASASFATPIGYQTNLMVYGPGGYRFSDFLRIGVPMTIVTGTVVLLVPRIWSFA